MSLCKGTGSLKQVEFAQSQQDKDQERRLAAGIDPSPKEITRLCQQIQATWSKYERRKRRIEPYYPVEVHKVRVLAGVETYQE